MISTFLPPTKGEVQCPCCGIRTSGLHPPCPACDHSGPFRDANECQGCHKLVQGSFCRECFHRLPLPQRGLLRVILLFSLLMQLCWFAMTMVASLGQLLWACLWLSPALTDSKTGAPATIPSPQPARPTWLALWRKPLGWALLMSIALSMPFLR